MRPSRAEGAKFLADFAKGSDRLRALVIALAAGPPTVQRRRAGTANEPIERVGGGIRAIFSNSSVVPITIAQSNEDAKNRALLELDHQRILALQARAPNLIVGP
jgi:hypothetical protein